MLLGFTILSAHAADIRPNTYLPSIQDRERYSDIVCSATILKTHATGNVEQFAGEERSEWVAEARVDSVFKGFLGSQFIVFKYYGLGPAPTSQYFGVPYAAFRSGGRYGLFLRGQGSDLAVTIPFYRMEIEIASRPLDKSGDASNLRLARELLFAIDYAPQTLGRAATQYFTWVEELCGNASLPLIKRFLTSNDQLIRYQAAWWLSFRQLDALVVNELEQIAQADGVEEWARCGASNRLAAIGGGVYVTHCDGGGGSPLIPTSQSELPSVLEAQPKPKF